MTSRPKPVKDNPEWFRLCHERWMEKRNRRNEDPAYRDEWWSQQCGACRYWVPLSGVFAEDYGVCAGSTSDFDGLVRFEHDGCAAHESTEGWVLPDGEGTGTTNG
jgi:hypothetical protein